ncbi:pre-mRNA splicing factor component domain containing protein [Amanita muscaria]
MVRIIIKGGVWKNTEDEVLKAAIAKYGKNQWARISSLLVRKTPKQCKARWYEWLDPSIKKTEWSKTEDEKLLHLAKLMPTQWRTIAPIVGRTATQCLERYQKLLDEAEAKENEEFGLSGTSDAIPSADDVRKLRPGEIDPDPETKPARPDPIDMDEDEKEMLSEARARLANTQGKKAKRKARERQLEEARRLAVLQKKRELKEAGIIMRHKTKRKGMDYNADIPLEKRPVPGFYDTSEEQARVAAPPVGQSLRRLENKRKPQEEELERKKRQRKNANAKDGEHQTKFIPARDAQIQKLKEAESIGRRRKLVLPGEQVGEAELENIAKIGQAGESAKTLVEGGTDASSRLLSEYESLGSVGMTRTPRTAPQRDNVMMEARNLRNMTISQTPLLGEENTPLHILSEGGTGFEGATPQHQIAFTPNPLATPLRDEPSTVSAHRASATPLRTPLRDNLLINANETGGSQAYAIKRALKDGFLNLPKPENNFELVVPESEEETEESIQLEADATERDAHLRRLKEEEEQKLLARRSLVIQRNLPRPAVASVDTLLQRLDINDKGFNSDDFVTRQLIHVETARLVHRDSIAHPLPGTNQAGAARSAYEIPPDEDISRAKEAIHKELASTSGFPDARSDQLRQGLCSLHQGGTPNGSTVWVSMRRDLVYDEASHIWAVPQDLSMAARVAGYNSLLADKRDAMTRDASKATKAEKKLSILLGGYQSRFHALSARLVAASEAYQTLKADCESFSRLRLQESVSGPRRVGSLKEEVERLESKEGLLQAHYAALEAERNDFEGRIASLEEKVMAEAEMLNQEHL